MKSVWIDQKFAGTCHATHARDVEIAIDGNLLRDKESVTAEIHSDHETMTLTRKGLVRRDRPFQRKYNRALWQTTVTLWVDETATAQRILCGELGRGMVILTRNKPATRSKQREFIDRFIRSNGKAARSFSAAFLTYEKVSAGEC